MKERGDNMVENKWLEFESPRYRLQDLGRPAVFLIPLSKLRQEIDGVTIEERLRRFLTANFAAYSATEIPSFGVWLGSGREIVFDESRQYKVSFVGKDRIRLLLEKLRDIAVLAGEECIYFEAGQYACLIWPR